MESKVTKLFCHICKAKFLMKGDDIQCVECQSEFTEEIHENEEELENFEPYNAVFFLS